MLRGLKSQKERPSSCWNSQRAGEVNNVFTLKKVDGIWYLNGIEYRTLHEALTVVFSHR